MIYPKTPQHMDTRYDRVDDSLIMLADFLGYNWTAPPPSAVEEALLFAAAVAIMVATTLPNQLFHMARSALHYL